MLLAFSRYLAFLYAIGLATGETILNTMLDQWQYAPMWIIDYLIAAYLLVGFWTARQPQGLPVLMSAYALSAGVMYMALFIAFDPDLQSVIHPSPTVVTLLGLVLDVSVVGLVSSTVAWWRGPFRDASAQRP